jgi:hypothetical protein
LDPSSKRFQLDVRSLANLDWRLISEEAAKCTLLCSNCHAEHHNPGFDRSWCVAGAHEVEDAELNDS